MKKLEIVYAFIDGQNLYSGIESQGWHLDYKKFRRYLSEKYGVQTAYLFIGYLAENKTLYESLQKNGYVLIFKPVIPDAEGKPKGNVDADLVLQTMIDLPNYKRAVLVTSDGDFYSLVNYLYKKNKLEKVLSPYTKTCSVLLRKTAKERILYMNNLKRKLGYKRKSTA